MDSLLLFDADFMLYYATMGNKVFDLEGNPLRKDNKFVYTEKTLEEVYRSCDDIIINIFNKSNIYKYIGFLGGKKCFRYDIYPEYKANRKNLVKPIFLQECKNYLIERWGFETCDYIEADDAVNITRNELKNYNSIIVTSDKDLIKCIEGTYINPKDLDIYYTSKNVADYNFWSSMIIGDTADNIKGLPKCGIKFAEKLLKNSKDYKQSVFDTYIEKYDNQGEYELQYNLLKILDYKEDFIIPVVKDFIIERERELDEWIMKKSTIIN